MPDPYVFIIGDGDKVRDRLDALMFAGDLESLKSLSAAVSSAVSSVANGATAAMGGDIVVAGGDDLLLRLPAEYFDLDVLERLRKSFQALTGCSLSIGVATELDGAYLNLRRAKARGGDVIVVT